jgi:hypothetical protein
VAKGQSRWEKGFGLGADACLVSSLCRLNG